MSSPSISYNRVFTKIQSSLPSAIDNNNVNILKECINFKVSESIKLCIEAAVRAYLMKTVCIGKTTNLNEIKIIVTICIEGTKQDLCLPTLPVYVLADAFDCISITQSEELFSFVEEKVSIWKSDVFFASCKNQVLRMCNDVLRRLSRSQNTIFCGRILLFLARFFPFSERSGLNLVSEFNLENVTNFTGLESDDCEMKPVDDEVVKASVDHTLYTKFWSLQDFFRSPMQCFQKTQWKLFTMYAEQIFEAFSSFKLESIQRKKSKGVKEKTTISANEAKSQCFPKYLTNQELLDLQFADSNFRRYVLLQMLILGQYLTANIKFKQKSLTSDQINWIDNMTEKVYNLLGETPPNGQFFVEVVKHIIKRENMWNEWKNSGCPEDKKRKETAIALSKRPKIEESADMPLSKKIKKRLGDVVKEADATNNFAMGTPEMTRLWNICPNNFDACKQKNRQFVPTLEQYFEPANELYKQKGIRTTAEELSSDSNFAWKALRLLILKSPHLFSNAMLFTLQDYISDMLKVSHKDAEAQKIADKQTEENDEDKVMINNSDAVKDDEEDEEDNGNQREGFQPIQPDEIAKLAEALNRKGANAWLSLGKKLGFEKDELEFFQAEGKSKLKVISIMLERWVGNEKEEANRSCLTYTLEGLKMEDVSKIVFG